MSVISIEIGVIAVVLAVIGILMQIPQDKLELGLMDVAFKDSVGVNKQPARLLLVAVRNKDKRKTARNCYVFMKSLRNAETGEEYIKEVFGLTWSEYKSPSAHILPETYREFNSFLRMKSRSDMPLMDDFFDSDQLIPPTQGLADLIAEYWVVSDNFKIAKGVFVIHLDKDMDKVSISKKQ